MTEAKKKCACCVEGCNCGDCSACSSSSSGSTCCKGSCSSSWGCCAMSWWKWLLGILLLALVFCAGAMVGSHKGSGKYGKMRGGEGCPMMKMMHGDKGDMKGMMGCGMKDGGNCGMGGCGMMKEKEGSITTGQIVGMTGEHGTGN